MDPTPPVSLSLRYAALSDVGRVRKDNQDSGFASENLLVIADGVGGAARGDVASSTAVQILRRLDEPPPEDLLEALAGALHRAHDRIAELVEQDPELDGTSTTVTAALFDGSRIGVAHIGDSRGYLLRDGVLSQLTKDHTFVQSLIDEGRITEEESRTHPHRNLILRAVDGVHETDPDLFVVDLAPGDRVLLCSDGASGVLDNDRLADILGTGSVDYAVVELVRASLEAGSSDNVTCVVADVIDPAALPPDQPFVATTSGPVLVGAAAEQPRRAGSASRSFFRGHRGGDTGEIEPVPGEDEEIDPEELRYAPRPPRRFAWLRRIALLLVLLLVVGALAALGYRWTQDQYYVAAHQDRVTIFRGVQADVPGLTMHQVAQTTNVTLESLPDYPAEQVRSGIGAEDLGDAHDIVSRLTGLATVCPTPSPSPSPSPKNGGKNSKPSQGPSAGRSPRASARPSSGRSPSGGSTQRAADATKKPSGSASPSASPTPTIKPPHCIESTP
ncbi:MAG: PP2C family protein-serine/threonine phosphatase [Nocardioidaceae bacterium]